MDKGYHFGKYFSKQFYSELKRKVEEFFEDISPFYNRNSLIRQMKKENPKNNNLEKVID